MSSATCRDISVTFPAKGNGNSEGGPALATEAHGDDTRNGNVRGPPALGKVMWYGIDTAAGAVANDAERCHEHGINKRWRPRHQAELRRDGG